MIIIPFKIVPYPIEFHLLDSPRIFGYFMAFHSLQDFFDGLRKEAAKKTS